MPYENQLPALVPVADAVSDHPLAEHGRELRRKVAHLIGVRKQNQIRLGAFDYLFQRDAISVRRVRFEQVMLDGQNFGDVFRGQLIRERCHTLPHHQRAHRA